VPSSSTPVPSHWSKDFVEHLRTVHFALIAVSVGLILLVLSSSQYNAVTALVQVQEILDLKRQWSSDWIKRHGNALQKYVMPQSEIEYLHFRPAERSISLTSESGTNVILIVPKSDHMNSLIIEATMPKENYHHLTKTDTDWSPSKFPQTLSEFGEWWDGLAATPPIYFPDSIQEPAQIGVEPSMNVPVDSKGMADLLTASFSKVVAVDLRLKHIESSRPSGTELQLQPVDVIYTGVFQQKTIEGELTIFDSETVDVAIDTFKQYNATQDCVFQSFKNLRPGAFKQSFRDLSFAAGAEADLPLENVRDFLHDEAAKGPEVFEAFGMKFPAGQITLWGDLLLVSIQLYFFIYLRQLSGKLRPADPGWDVPWIGMDSSRLSNTIFYITLVILPCVASIMLSWQATIRLSAVYWERTEHWFHPIHFLAWPWHWQYSALLKIFLLVLAAVATGYLGLLSWKYRPQVVLAAPSCRAQLFE
jgi:hypothetical protein